MRFFACYLLTPVHPPHRLRCTYVGFTVSPTRRIRQHNGEIVNGAKRTEKHRPCSTEDSHAYPHARRYAAGDREMVAVVHGFPSKFHALQCTWWLHFVDGNVDTSTYCQVCCNGNLILHNASRAVITVTVVEYAWQHPYICRLTRERLRLLKGKTGVGMPRSLKRKLVELHEILHVPPWSHFPLTISYTSEFVHNVAQSSGFYSLPEHMRCETKLLDGFRCVGVGQPSSAEDHDTGGDDADDREGEEFDRRCFICEEDLDPSGATQFRLRCYYEGCAMQCHTLCLADHFISSLSMMGGGEEEHGSRGGVARSAQELLRPERGTCPDCQGELLWPLLAQQAQCLRGEKKKKATRRKKGVGANARASESLLNDSAVAEPMEALQPRVSVQARRDHERIGVNDCVELSRACATPVSASPCVYPVYNDDTWFENDDAFDDDLDASMESEYFAEAANDFETDEGFHASCDCSRENQGSDLDRANTGVIDLTSDGE